MSILSIQNIEDSCEQTINHTVGETLWLILWKVGDAEEASGVCVIAHVRIVGGEEDVVVGMVMSGNVPAQADLGLEEGARHVGTVDDFLTVKRYPESYRRVGHSVMNHFDLDRSIGWPREAAKPS